MPDTYESVVERRIREAMERGEFENLPGAGEPLRGAGEPYDEMWWVRAWITRNEIENSGAGSTPEPAAD